MAALIEAVGDDAARQLALRFGGTSVYVPRTIGAHHPLCFAVGRDAADRLADWFGGAALAIPKQPERRARVLQLRRAGALTVCQIALETAYSERQVYRLLREDADARQPGLFDDN